MQNPATAELTPVPAGSCPQCGSNHVQKVTLAYETGSSTSTAIVVGATTYGTAAGGVAAGQQQSLLASRLKPPENPDVKAGQWGCATTILVAIVGFALAAGGAAAVGSGVFTAFVAAPCVGIIVFLLLRLVAMPDYESRLASWDRQWICLRCGAVFERWPPAPDWNLFARGEKGLRSGRTLFAFGAAVVGLLAMAVGIWMLSFAKHPDAAWKEFRPPDEAVSILFPTTPSESREVVGSGVSTVTIRSYTAPTTYGALRLAVYALSSDS
jgi:hypothetical protein